MVKAEKNPPGQPTKYRTAFVKQAYKLCLLGLNDVQLAEALGVCERTLNNWKEEHPKFLQALRAGKEIADAEVAGSLYERACGYEHPEDKIFCTNNKDGTPVVTTVATTKHYPPDTAAAIIWLKNRQRHNWKDRHDVEHGVTKTVADIFALVASKRKQIESEVIDV